MGQQTRHGTVNKVRNHVQHTLRIKTHVENRLHVMDLLSSSFRHGPKRKKRQSLAALKKLSTTHSGNDGVSSSSYTAAKVGSNALATIPLAKPSPKTHGDTSALVSKNDMVLSGSSKEHGTAVLANNDATTRALGKIVSVSPASKGMVATSQNPKPTLQPDTYIASPTGAVINSHSKEDQEAAHHVSQAALASNTQASEAAVDVNNCSAGIHNASNHKKVREQSGTTGQAGHENTEPEGPIRAIVLQPNAIDEDETPQLSSTALVHTFLGKSNETGLAGRKDVQNESMVTVSMRKRGKRKRRVDSSTGEPEPPIKRDQSSYRHVRLLLRLGLLPVASLIDSFWFSQLHKFTSEHLLQRKYTAGSEADPFKDLRLPTPKDSVPSRSKDLDGRPDIFDKYKTMLAPVRNDIVALAKTAMMTMARHCLGDIAQHERQFAQFDALEWCTHFRPRCILYASASLMCRRFGEDQGQALLKKFSPTIQQRAELGLNLLTIVFAGILAVFRNYWHQSRSKSLHRYGGRLLSDKLLERVFRTSGPPAWSRQWVRALLFSCPFEEDMEETDEDRTIQHIGVNLEFLCLLQLATVMHMEQNKLENYRNENLQGSPFTLESVDKGASMQVIFSAGKQSTPRLHNQNGTTVQYTLKSGVYPWNKVTKWETNLAPISKQVLVENGSFKNVKSSRCQEAYEIITQERDMMKKHTKRIQIQPVQDAITTNDEKKIIDLLADLIVQRGAGSFLSTAREALPESDDTTSDLDNEAACATKRNSNHGFTLSDEDS